MTYEYIKYTCKDYPGECCPDCHHPKNERYDVAVVSLGDGTGANALVCCAKEKQINQMKFGKNLRNYKGERKLSDAQVEEIRNSSAPTRAVAELFGISTVWVRRIRGRLARTNG